ncbi:MAG: hypothetical protein EBU90_21305 [Proteobacteria bacterium]|nr:hypothetical protein [Pseudomonadota bacterium]
MEKAYQYQQARRIGKISLSDLIAKNIIEGESIPGAIGTSISQKFKARATRFKEKFDPLNIASMLVGRSRLGTAILGRLMGRSGEDIAYFAKKGSRTGGARNPFYTRIGSNSTEPVRRNDNVADVFSKVYNLMDRMDEQEKRLREIQENFREEQEVEDERRHSELLEAITGEKKPTASKIKEKKDGGIFDMIKNMFSNLMSFMSPFINLAKTIMTSFGSGFMSLIARLGAFLLSPVGVALLGLLTVAALGKYVYDLWLQRDAEQTKKALESGGGAAGAGYGGEAEYESMKESPEKEAAREKIIQKFMKDKKGDITDATLPELNALRDDILQYGDPRLQLKTNPTPLIKDRSAKLNRIEEEIKKRKETQPSAVPALPKQIEPSSATPEPSAPSAMPEFKPLPTGVVLEDNESRASKPIPVSNIPSVPVIENMMKQNFELNLQENTEELSPPVILNRNSVGGISLDNGESGTSTGAAPIRNDSLENIMMKLRNRSSVM